MRKIDVYSKGAVSVKKLKKHSEEIIALPEEELMSFFTYDLKPIGLLQLKKYITVLSVAKSNPDADVKIAFLKLNMDRILKEVSANAENIPFVTSTEVAQYTSEAFKEDNYVGMVGAVAAWLAFSGVYEESGIIYRYIRGSDILIVPDGDSFLTVKQNGTVKKIVIPTALGKKVIEMSEIDETAIAGRGDTYRIRSLAFENKDDCFKRFQSLKQSVQDWNPQFIYRGVRKFSIDYFGKTIALKRFYFSGAVHYLNNELAKRGLHLSKIIEDYNRHGTSIDNKTFSLTSQLVSEYGMNSAFANIRYFYEQIKIWDKYLTNK